MLPLDPPLAALHGARLDRAGEFARGLIDAAEHLTVSMLQLNSVVLDRLCEKTSRNDEHLSPLLAFDLATDPELMQMHADIYEAQIQMAAELATRSVALGEWHQHGLNHLVGNWFARVERSYSGLPLAAGAAVARTAIESADRGVSAAAVAAVDATETIADEAIRVETTVRPRRRRSAS